jgi:uncharacterized protein (TIGR01777 family)
VRVTVLGASGFIGGALVRALAGRADAAVSASLRDPERAAALSAGSDVVVNLAGASIAGRWTAARKRAIAESRSALPHAYLDALRRVASRPSVYVSASAIGYYGTSRDATFTESSPPGHDFLADVCVAWEGEAERARELGMRVARVRTGLVLGRDGGAFARLQPVFALGLGGIVGDGGQWYSWIHLDDLIALYLHAIDEADGALDATAPEPVTNRAFTRELGRALGRPTPFPVPRAALALLLGEGAVLLTEGQRVLPEAALRAGFAFRYPTVDRAFANLCRGR